MSFFAPGPAFIHQFYMKEKSYSEEEQGADRGNYGRVKRF